MKTSIVFLLLSAYSVAQVGTYREITAVHAPIRKSDANQAAYEGILSSPNSSMLSSQTPLINMGQTVNADSWSIDSENTTFTLNQLLTDTTGAACSPTFNNWAYLDAIPLGGTEGGVQYTAYKTNFILVPADEGNTSNATPECVWSQEQADAAALQWTAGFTYLAGWYINVNGTFWQIQSGCYTSGKTTNACTARNTTEPACLFTNDSTCTDGVAPNTFKWVNIGAHGKLQDGYCGYGHSCNYQGVACNTSNPGAVYSAASLGTCNVNQLYQSQPIPWELPYWSWGQKVIAQFISHYNSSPALSNIGYIRVGWPMGGELGGLGLTTWPYGNSTGGYQLLYQYEDMVNVLDAFIIAQKPAMHTMSDINCGADVGTGFNACLYADMEAQIANTNHFTAIGNQDATIMDYYNLTAVGNPSTKCAWPLVPSACTAGDWAYNFTLYPNMYHELQTLNGSSPYDCSEGVPGFTGPLGQLASTYCTNDFPGLLNWYESLGVTGINGTKININVFEADTTGYAEANSCSNSGELVWECSSLSDILFTLLTPQSSYEATNNSIPIPTNMYSTALSAYQSAFTNFLSQ